jgi:hypothetical protein
MSILNKEPTVLVPPIKTIAPKSDVAGNAVEPNVVLPAPEASRLRLLFSPINFVGAALYNAP